MQTSALGQLAKIFPPDRQPEDIREAMDYAGLLGWDLERGPAFSQRDGSLLEIPGVSAVTRKGVGVLGHAKALGVVGSAYRIRNNEEFIPFMQELSDKLQARPTYAGHFDDSRRVLVALYMPREIPDTEPAVGYFVALSLDHSGNLAPSLDLLPVDLLTKAVMNVFSWPAEALVMDPAAERFGPRVAHAAQSFQLSQRMAHEKFWDLRDWEVNPYVVRQMALQALGNSTSSPAALTRTENKVEQVLHRFRELPGESAYTALQAFCSYWDFDAPVRGEEPPELMRARRAIYRPELKARAYNYLADLKDGLTND